MLEGYLYTVLEKSEGRALIKTLPESPVYRAHFPDFPITPGVCLVRMAMELMGKQLTGAKDIKFLTPVFPDSVIRFEWTPEGVVTVFLADGTLCVKMNLTCR